MNNLAFEVVKLLRRVTGQVELDPRIQLCLDSFDPAQFNLEQVVASLHAESLVAKRKILELIVAVHEADQSWDFSEDDYVRKVGSALGLEPAEYEDFVIGEIHVESGGFVVLPPPMPVKT